MFSAMFLWSVMFVTQKNEPPQREPHRVEQSLTEEDKRGISILETNSRMQTNPSAILSPMLLQNLTERENPRALDIYAAPASREQVRNAATLVSRGRPAQLPEEQIRKNIGYFRDIGEVFTPIKPLVRGTAAVGNLWNDATAEDSKKYYLKVRSELIRGSQEQIYTAPVTLVDRILGEKNPRLQKAAAAAFLEDTQQGNKRGIDLLASPDQMAKNHPESARAWAEMKRQWGAAITKVGFKKNQGEVAKEPARRRTPSPVVRAVQPAVRQAVVDAARVAAAGEGKTGTPRVSDAPEGSDKDKAPKWTNGAGDAVECTKVLGALFLVAGDKQTAKELYAVHNAGKSLIAGFKTMSPLGIAGGVADAIFGLAGLGGPSDTEILLSHISEIKAMVREVHDDLAKLSGSVAELRRDVMMRLDQILERLDRIEDHLANQSDALWSLARKIESLDAAVSQMAPHFKAILAQHLAEVANGRASKKDTPENEVKTARVDLLHFVQKTAKQSAISGGPYAGRDVSTICRELGSYLVRERGGPKELPGEQLASFGAIAAVRGEAICPPDVWVWTATAFADSLQQRQSVKTPNTLSGMLDEGTRLALFTRGLCPARSDGSADLRLVEEGIAAYCDGAKEFCAALNGRIDSYQTATLNGYRFMGGVTQSPRDQERCAPILTTKDSISGDSNHAMGEVRLSEHGSGTGRRLVLKIFGTERGNQLFLAEDVLKKRLEMRVSRMDYVVRYDTLGQTTIGYPDRSPEKYSQLVAQFPSGYPLFLGPPTHDFTGLTKFTVELSFGGSVKWVGTLVTPDSPAELFHSPLGKVRGFKEAWPNFGNEFGGQKLSETSAKRLNCLAQDDHRPVIAVQQDLTGTVVADLWKHIGSSAQGLRNRLRTVAAHPVPSDEENAALVEGATKMIGARAFIRAVIAAGHGDDHDYIQLREIFDGPICCLPTPAQLLDEVLGGLDGDQQLILIARAGLTPEVFDTRLRKSAAGRWGKPLLPTRMDGEWWTESLVARCNYANRLFRESLSPSAEPVNVRYMLDRLSELQKADGVKAN